MLMAHRSAQSPRPSSGKLRPVLFGRYLLLERLAIGGMAELFIAKAFRRSKGAALVAIKRILPSMEDDQEFVTMFIDEARIAGQLNHENIVPIYELGRIGDSHFIAMEFIWGKDILQIINRFRRIGRRMPPDMAAWIAVQMARGLAYAHRQKDANGKPMDLIHRDVSPQNILVGYDGGVKVIDFGIARAATRSSRTETGVLKGKFGYMSPEQVTSGKVDHRSDIFSLGTCMYEMLTCERLFHSRNEMETLEIVGKARVRPLHEAVPGHVPPQLESIVLRALALEPKNRFANADFLVEALEAFLANHSPDYTRSTLAAWMRSAFRDEIAQERRRLDVYRAAQAPTLSSASARADSQPTLAENKALRAARSSRVVQASASSVNASIPKPTAAKPSPARRNSNPHDTISTGEAGPAKSRSIAPAASSNPPPASAEDRKTKDLDLDSVQQGGQPASPDPETTPHTPSQTGPGPWVSPAVYAEFSKVDSEAAGQSDLSPWTDGRGEEEDTVQVSAPELLQRSRASALPELNEGHTQADMRTATATRTESSAFRPTSIDSRGPSTSSSPDAGDPDAPTVIPARADEMQTISDATALRARARRSDLPAPPEKHPTPRQRPLVEPSRPVEPSRRRTQGPSGRRLRSADAASALSGDETRARALARSRRQGTGSRPWIAVVLGSVVSLVGLGTGWLLLDSNKPGAVEVLLDMPHRGTVAIDGRPRGSTPLRIEKLAAGKHTIEVTLASGKTIAKAINLPARSNVVLHIVVTSNPDDQRAADDPDAEPSLSATTEVDREPRATLAKNQGKSRAEGNAANASPIESEQNDPDDQPEQKDKPAAAAGPDKSTKRSARDEATSASRRSKPGQAATTEPGKLNLSTVPSTRVFIDGKDTGQSTPLVGYRLSPGSHFLGLKSADGRIQSLRITIKAGETTRVFKRLR